MKLSGNIILIGIAAMFLSLCSNAAIRFETKLMGDPLNDYVHAVAESPDNRKIDSYCENNEVTVGFGIYGLAGFFKGKTYSCNPTDYTYTFVSNYAHDIGMFDGWVDTGIWYQNGKNVCFLIKSSRQEDLLLDCGNVVASDTVCEPKSGDPVFDFGQLTQSSINGATLDKSIQINCNAGTDATLSILDSNVSSEGVYLSSDRTIFSRFKINGAPMAVDGLSVKFKSGINTIKLTSVLEASGSVPKGVYSASGVLLIAPQ